MFRKFERESFESSVGNENVIALLPSYKLHLLLQNTINTVKFSQTFPVLCSTEDLVLWTLSFDMISFVASFINIRSYGTVFSQSITYGYSQFFNAHQNFMDTHQILDGQT